MTFFRIDMLSKLYCLLEKDEKKTKKRPGLAIFFKKNLIFPFSPRFNGSLYFNFNVAPGLNVAGDEVHVAVAPAAAAAADDAGDDDDAVIRTVHN